jgi:lipid A 3-O-deacylase
MQGDTMNRHLRLALVLAFFGLPIGPANAEVQTYWDNDTDAFVPGHGGTDQNYSQGVRTNFFAAPGVLPAPTRWLADRLPGFAARGAERQFGLSLGQEIYTPRANTTRRPTRGDRPYAGWLYASGILSSRDTRWMRSLELQIGTTGPASHADDVQRWWHHRLGIRSPEGWQYQLRGEPGIVVSYQERRRPWGYRRHADFVPHAGATLGNVHTEASAGGTLRLGLPLPDDFGPWRNAAATSARRNFDLYVFARAEGRAVARNLFLDGNTFGSSMHVTRMPLVGEAQLGVAGQWRHVGLRYTFSYTTHEFRERTRSQTYGSFAIVI